MSGPFDNGGMAFPVEGIAPDFGSVVRHSGMTMLDYFAAHAPMQIDDSAQHGWIAMRTGIELPTEPPSDGRAWGVFWMKAEAALRYQYAEAMIAEKRRRERGGAA